MNLLINLQILKKTLQLLFSLSLLFFSYSSGIPYVLSQISDYSIDRSYMFLLCNGILVFLGLLGASSSKPSTDFEGQVYLENGVNAINYVADEKFDRVQSVGYLESLSHDQEDDDDGDLKKQSVIGDKEEDNGLIKEEEELQEEEEEEELNEKLDSFSGDIGGHGVLSTEELNKKCDEFIRKMKGEIRFEPHRQLILV